MPFYPFTMFSTAKNPMSGAPLPLVRNPFLRRLAFFFVMAIGLSTSVWASPGLPLPPATQQAGFTAKYSVLPDGRKAEADAVILVVSVADQCLVVIRGGKAERAYKVSTAKAGTGSKPNSDKTPLGWHRVSDWIGGDAVPGQVFVSRKAVKGEVLANTQWQSNAGRDYVLTRILWLDGLEWGRNKGPGADSHSRFIYLHGTNQEHLLGQPASHGCIRLSNHDVMVVYSLTAGHPTYVDIVEQF